MELANRSRWGNRTGVRRDHRKPRRLVLECRQMLRANLEEDETIELGKARPGKALKITLSNMVLILRVIGK